MVIKKSIMVYSFYLLLGLMISSLYSSCNSYPLSGQIDMTDSDKKVVVYLIEPNNFRSLVASYGGKVIDSAIIDKKGVFYFEQMPESSQKKMYLLVLQGASLTFALRKITLASHKVF